MSDATLLLEQSATELVALDDTDRVRAHTRPGVQEEIDRMTMARLDRDAAWVRDHPHRAEEYVEFRLQQLREEWDMERILETQAASLSLVGLALGLKDRRFLALPIAVSALLLQHALHGWCPPVPLFRRFGIRTRDEIDVEKHALRELLHANSDEDEGLARLARGSSEVGEAW